MAVTRTEVTELYIATFDRAPDATGLAYWVDSGLTIEEIAQSFFDQPETQTKYPDTLSDAQFVEAIYNNVYNRTGDPDGAAYWVNELENGTPRNVMIISMVNGAQNTSLGQDQSTLDNKTEVGLSFADAGLNDLQDAENIMKNVTDDNKTVTAAETQIDKWEEDVSDYTMKVTDDDWTGTDGDDIVKGQIGVTTTTYAGADKLDALAGNDELKLKITAGITQTAGAATVDNFETLNITDNATATSNTTFDLTRYDTSVETIKVSGTNAGTVIFGAAAGTRFDNVVDNIELTKTVAATTRVNYEAATIVGGADAMSITLGTGAAQTFITNGIENLTLHTGAGVETITIRDVVAQSLTIDGSAILTVATPIGTAFTSVDASGMGAGGSLAIGTGSFNTASNTTVVGSDGRDTLALAGAASTSITGGAGADAITLAAGAANTLHYANEGDTGITIGSADAVTGFTTGTDRIDFDSLVGGSGVSFAAATTTLASFTVAKGQADTAMHNNATYFFATDGTDGYLFVDSNADGAADEVITLIGLTATNDLLASDIIA